MAELPLGHRAYGSIAHLPGSRVGPADRHIDPRQAALLTGDAGAPGREVLVQEKLDGSCVCAARVGDTILALGREGALAERSASENRRLWAAWVREREGRFRAALRDGERLVGEWLALAHGTRYELRHEPFVAFDLMRGATRAAYDELQARAAEGGFPLPGLLHRGPPLATDAALRLLAAGGFHGALDPVEGAVWRMEGRGPRGARRVELVAKFVRHGKRDGAYLPENSGGSPLWNWRP